MISVTILQGLKDIADSLRSEDVTRSIADGNVEKLADQPRRLMRYWLELFAISEVAFSRWEWCVYCFVLGWFLQFYVCFCFFTFGRTSFFRPFVLSVGGRFLVHNEWVLSAVSDQLFFLI